MSNSILILEGAINQGILWGIMAIGVFITFRILDFPDLTVDGSLSLGAAVCARMLTLGYGTIFSILIATIAGLLAGYLTAFLHNKFKIPAILSGILSQLSLYSINLRIMSKPNISLINSETIFTKTSKLFLKFGISINSELLVLIIGLVITIIIVSILYWFFGTEIGCVIRATGHNPAMVRAQGQNTQITTTLALMISNGLVALSGSLIAMHQGYADVQMGVGSIVVGLAAIVIGEVIFKKRNSFFEILLTIVYASIVYRLIIALVLKAGLKTNDLKVFTAIIVSLALASPELRKFFLKRS